MQNTKPKGLSCLDSFRGPLLQYVDSRSFRPFFNILARHPLRRCFACEGGPSVGSRTGWSDLVLGFHGCAVAAAFGSAAVGGAWHVPTSSGSPGGENVRAG